MPQSNNLVETTTDTTGTGGLTLSDVTGRQNFAEAFPTGTGGTDVFWYAIANRDADEWEVGSGAFISSLLKRQTIIASSNADARVTFSAGTKDVTSDVPWSLQIHSGINNIPVGTDGVYPETNKVGTLGKPANMFESLYMASEGAGIYFGLGTRIRRVQGAYDILRSAADWAPDLTNTYRNGTPTLRWTDLFLATSGSLGAGIDWGAAGLACATAGAVQMTGSVRHTAVDDGTPTNLATYTVSDANGNMRTLINGGSAWKIAPQTSDSVVIFFIENSATPGTVTATGDYDVVKGDAFTTATGDDFICTSTVLNGRSSLVVQDATNNIA